jgi:hypothetical protein
MFGRQPRYVCRLAVAGMVFPEPALSREVLGEPRIERQRDILRVHGQGTRPGGVHADADDLVGGKTGLLGRLGERSPDALLHAAQVIGRILAREMVIVAVEQHAVVAAGIVGHRTAQFGAGGAINDEGPHRVGAEINT